MEEGSRGDSVPVGTSGSVSTPQPRNISTSAEEFGKGASVHLIGVFDCDPRLARTSDRFASTITAAVAS